jgi:hypothetical protein
MERLSGASSPPFKVPMTGVPLMPLSWNEIRHRTISFLR